MGDLQTCLTTLTYIGKEWRIVSYVNYSSKMHFKLNNNNNWDHLYSAVRMGITKNKGTVTYKLIVIRLTKQKGLEVCFKAVYCRWKFDVIW